MAGDRGRSGGRRGSRGAPSDGRDSHTPQQGGSRPGAFTPATPNSHSGRGGARGWRAGGRGDGEATPGRSPCPPGGRGQGSAWGYRGNVQQSPMQQHRAGFATSGRGAAAVAAEDRQLLLVSKDPKMHRHVWELRIHPSRSFGQEWLAAVDRWIHNMTSSTAGHQGLTTPPPPPPPRSPAAAGAAVGAAPVPDDSADMDNDDYDYEFSSDSDNGHGEHDAVRSDAGSSGDRGASSASDDDVYDMVSYLKKVSLTDEQQIANEVDNISTATTVGSSVTGTRGSQLGQQLGRVAAETHARLLAGDDSAAESGSGSWQTDSEGGDDAILQQHHGEHEQAVGDALAAANANLSSPPAAAAPPAPAPQPAAAASNAQGLACQAGAAATAGHDPEDSHGGPSAEASGSETSDSAAAMDAALTAAEEHLLCEPGWKMQQLSQQQTPQRSVMAGTPSSSHQAQRAVDDLAGAGTRTAATDSNQKQPKQRRGDRKREKWAQQLMVSLRLEKQGLTDKEAQLLATWYSCSAAAQKLSIAKLWLFDNALGDVAADAVATLIGPDTVEIHLSHNQISVTGAKAVLEHVPLQRGKGTKPLWLRVEWNQIDANELRRFVEQDCAARGLVVDIANELPASERTRTDTRGRELNLAWSMPWQSVHVQMPWLSCQRSKPEEAAALQAAKAVWGKGVTAATGTGRPFSSTAQRSQQRSSAITAVPGSIGGSTGRMGGVVAAMTVAEAVDPDARELLWPSGPLPRSADDPAALAAGSSSSVSTLSAFQHAPLAAAEHVAACSAADLGNSRGSSQKDVEFQDGPLMLFIDTSAFLSMLGCPGNVATSTCFTLKLLQSLAGSGRFGRDLPAEQHCFIVLADTVLKQLDSFKSAEKGVGGPVRKFLDTGLDEVGPKGLDFLTVLAAHEGEGLVVDRQAAVAGSRSPMFAGSTGQRSDLAIIEVALFFRTELLAAAAAAAANLSVQGNRSGEPSTPTSSQQLEAAAAEAQPVILVTNDNAQLQLAKAHGLPAFKLAGAADFECKLSELIKAGGDLSSRALRQLMAPTAIAGLGAVAGRSLQDDFDGAVACTRGLLEAYQDLSGLLGRVNMLVSGAASGEEAAALQEISQLLQDYQHSTPFGEGNTAPLPGLSVLETVQGNIAALEISLQGWEARVRGRHTPSRVLKWASSSTARNPQGM